MYNLEIVNIMKWNVFYNSTHVLCAVCDVYVIIRVGDHHASNCTYYYSSYRVMILYHKTIYYQELQLTMLHISSVV